MKNALANSEDQDRTDERREIEPGEGLSGWHYLTKHQSVNQMIDALLDLPPNREFNQTELAEIAGVSRNSVGNHIEKLHELHIIEQVTDSSPTRYRLNTDSKITQSLIKMDGFVNEELNREANQ